MVGADHPTRRAWAIPELRAYAVARFCSALAHSLLRATVAWHLWKSTGSYAWLGWLGAVEFLPVIPFSLWAGVVADSADRKRIVMTTQAAAFVASVALYAGAVHGEGEVAVILATAVGLAIAQAFQAPAYASMLPALVPRELFPSATVINANARNLATVSGPVLMGLVSARFGVAGAYATAAGLFVLAVAFLARLPMLRPAGTRVPVTLASVVEGIAFVRGQAAILGSMVLDMFAVIFAGATALLPVYADEILGVGEVGYGVLSASMQVGTLGMAALLLVLPPLERPGRWLLWSVLFFGLSTIAFGLSRWFPLSVAAFALAGAADQVSMTARSIILQLSTPDALRGRVSSVNMIFIGASNELGAAESGFLAALTSATFSVVFGGGACLGVLGWIAARNGQLRDFRVAPEAQT